MKVGSGPVSKNVSRFLENKTKKFTQNLKKIKEETGIAEITIRSWINGSKNPQFGLLEKVAKVLNVDVMEFYGINLPPQKKRIWDKLDTIENHESLRYIELTLDMVLAKEKEKEKQKKEKDGKK